MRFVLAGLVGVCALASGIDTLGAEQVASGQKERLRKPRPDMAMVTGGMFYMGIDETELADAIDACREEFGSEAAPYVCEQLRNLPEAHFGQGRMIYLSPYQIDRFETTVAEYRQCVASGACDLVPLVSGDTRFMVDALPMVNVTWFDALTYCRWRHKRLPTEAEWEKAARGTDARRWPWGSTDGQDRANRGKIESEELRNPRAGDFQSTVDESDGAKIMAPPGTFRWGKSPYGVYDMSGNVSEWVSDWFSMSGYALLPTIDPHGAASGTYRVVRGGSYEEPRLWGRTYVRSHVKPSSRGIARGFRCARDVP